MKVTSEGISPNTWKTNIVCPTCNAELEINYSDLCYYKITTWWGKKKYGFNVTCCECDQTIEVSRCVPSCIEKKFINNMSLEEKIIYFYF